MKSLGLICLKVMLVVALGLAILYCWPALTMPLAFAAVLVLGFGLLMLAGLVAAGAVGIGVVTVLMVVAIAVLGALSPLWIPLLLVLGCIWLIKKLCAPKGPNVTAA